MLFSLILGKQYRSVELPKENKYDVTGKELEKLKEMADHGSINEAENVLLESLDYDQKGDILKAILFYQYISEKDAAFLQSHNYSKEEALEGIKRLAENQGYGQILSTLTDNPD